MMTKTWLLLNAALMLLAAVSINSLVNLPATLKKQKEQTAKAIKGTDKDKDKGVPATANAKGAKGSARRSISRLTPPPQQAANDTWPQIRRGSLTAIWKHSLFSKDRTETLAGETPEDVKKDNDEALPAPPNFELIGILTVNDAKVAIIELKSNSAANRQGFNPRMMRRPMGRPDPTPVSTANSADAFTPSFVTAHENDPLKETGYKVTTIDAVANTVTLSKEGLDYRLKLDRNSSNAAQRKDSQNAYAQSVKDKAKAAEARHNATQQQQAQQQQAQQQQAQQQNNGMPPLPPGATPVMPNNRGIPQPASGRPTRPGFTSNGTQPSATPGGNGGFRQPGVRFTRPAPAMQQ